MTKKFPIFDINDIKPEETIWYQKSGSLIIFVRVFNMRLVLKSMSVAEFEMHNKIKYLLRDSCPFFVPFLQDFTDHDIITWTEKHKHILSGAYMKTQEMDLMMEMEELKESYTKDENIHMKQFITERYRNIKNSFSCMVRRKGYFDKLQDNIIYDAKWTLMPRANNQFLSNHFMRPEYCKAVIFQFLWILQCFQENHLVSKDMIRRNIWWLPIKKEYTHIVLGEEPDIFYLPLKQSQHFIPLIGDFGISVIDTNQCDDFKSIASELKSFKCYSKYKDIIDKLASCDIQNVKYIINSKKFDSFRQKPHEETSNLITNDIYFSPIIIDYKNMAHYNPTCI